VVVLEDDIVVSRHFLRFMNDGLAACEDRDPIYQISGYFIPHRRDLPAVGAMGAPACWGWATWRRAWRWYNDDAAALYEQVRQGNTRAFDINGTYHNLEALRRNAEGTLDTWGVRWYASMFLRGGMVVYPALSLTRNIGFGGGGTNCGASAMDRIYLRQRIARQAVAVDWAGLPDTPNKDYAETLEEFYRFQHRQWTLTPWPVRLRAKIRRMLRV
jgi:GR25 family glycosyltransferase involved in LPS biosynthesis